MFVWRLMVYLALLMAVAHIDGTERPKCGNKSDCPADDKPICALEPNDICFHRFQSQCEMGVSECNHERKYLIYPDSYCDNPSFMCDVDYNQYVEWWNKNENSNDIIYSIYNPTENAAMWPKTFWKKMLNITDEEGIGNNAKQNS